MRPTYTNYGTVTYDEMKTVEILMKVTKRHNYQLAFLVSQYYHNVGKTSCVIITFFRSLVYI